MFGHAGRVLHVDLGTRKAWTEATNPDLAAKYLGARGINTRLLWESVKPAIDPLGPENVLIFGAGALSGTHAPSSGRTTITSKSPATQRYVKTNAGGYWGPQLKFAGYDHVIVYGASDKPVYLWIDDDMVEVRDATALWGLPTPATEVAIRQELGVPNLQTAAIGPAGENLAKMAAIMLSRSFAAGRCGTGAVMGSKKLKAIAVRGTGSLKVARPDEFGALVAETRQALVDDSSTLGLYQYGTSGLVEGVNAGGMLPSYNYRQGYFDEIEKITGQYLVNEGLLNARLGCASCAINCHRHFAVPTGRYAGSHGAGPEYETVTALGSGCGVSDMEALVTAAGLCNDLGMDTISTGGVIQWAMECYERGIFSKDEVDGLDLSWGNGEVVVELVRKIAHREGIGDLLAEGTKIASERVGGDSWQWAVQANGLEQSRVETRLTMAYALAFLVNPRGPDHLMTECIAEFGLSPEGLEVIRQITGEEKYANPSLTEKRADIVRWHEDCYAVTDSLGFCAFATTLAYGVTPARMAALFSAATGIDMSEEDIMRAGRRIVTLERSFNLREGQDRKNDQLPYRLTHEKIATGPGAGAVNSKKVTDKMLDEYFALHEWDVKTGRPTKATLRKLDLGFVADQLGDKIPA